MSSKINLQTCEYACKSSIFQDNQLIFHKSQNLTSSEIISKARNIAIDIIQEKINLSNDNPNKPLLVEALKKVSKVKPSEEVV